MHAVMLAALVLFVGCEARIPHLERNPFRQQAASNTVMQALGVEAALSEHMAQQKREASATQYLLPGFFDGIRVKVVDTWLDNSTHTCQTQTPATKKRGGGNPKEPNVYYTPQALPAIPVFNRDSAVPLQHIVDCKPAYIVDRKQKAYLRGQLFPKLVRQLSYLLAPNFKGSGGTAAIAANACNGRCMRCLNDHFVFHLTAPYTFPDHDLVVFVTAEPDKTASYATPCLFGSDGRPTVMVINVAPNKLAAVGNIPNGAEKLFSRVLQSAIHALGFDTNMFSFWKQGNTPALSIPSAAGATVNVIRTPHVRTWVNTVQFRCTGHPNGGSGNVEGAELEDALQSGLLPYWESRLYKGELMTMLPDIEVDFDLDLPVLSGLTLAALADTGWYAVNTKMAKPLKWLREQPCSTALSSCTSWAPRYTCTREETQPLCSPDFTAVSRCSGLQWPSGAIPDKFRRDGVVINWGGASSLMDFCPFRDPSLTQDSSCLVRKDTDQDCQNGKCTDYQVKGVTSRCFESTLRYSAYGGTQQARGTCIPHTCTRVGVPRAGQPQQWRVTLEIGGQQYTCDGSATHVGPDTTGVTVCTGATLVGTVKCPDARELCEEAGVVVTKDCDPLIDCNGRGVCGADGQCVCFSELNPDGNTLYGMYAGPRCERCLEGYFGDSCKQKKCPVDAESGAMCYGNGICTGSGICTCNMNATHGYYSNTTGCSTCFVGYTGGTCKLAVCDPASTSSCTKGVCDATTKRCKCYGNNAQGYWQLGNIGKCDRCVPGYDIHQSCKVKIGTYYGCDAALLPDTLNLNPCIAACDDGMAVPQRVSIPDERGCAFTNPSQWCARSRCRFVGRAGNVTGSRPGAPSGCPTPSVVAFDCQGFPNLYHDCWLVDECGCQSPRPPQCVVGTDAVVSPDAYDPIANIKTPQGSTDIRPRSAATSNKECRCPSPGYRPLIDCWGPTEANAVAPGGFQVKRPPVAGRVVLFEPEQSFEEDFCHCTSPPIPRCSDQTRPEFLPENKQGTVVSCANILKTFGCPDWNMILNVGGARNRTEPDYSLMDCDGWPPPKLVKSRDKCGCPFPQFKCIEGTMGVCGAKPRCPKWDPLPPINCVDQMPPTLTLHAPHPCGCPPPPTPACIPGTARPLCTCIANGAQKIGGTPCSPLDTEWVDCKGSPLEAPAWSPYRTYPNGDPFLNTCDPCPGCPKQLPKRRCIPGTDTAVPAVPNVVPRPCASSFDPTTCLRWPPPCPVDCQGRPPAVEIDYNPACECPPEVPSPACLPGTDGSAPQSDERSVSCESTPQICGAYACGGAGHNVEALAEGMGYAGEYSAAARNAVLRAIGGTHVCVQEGQCASDYHCAAGYHCGYCGLCLAGNKQVYTGCLADRGASCGHYRCSIECNAEGIARLTAGETHAICNEKCTADTDCTPGALCSLGAYSADPMAGAALQGRVQIIGKAVQQKTTPPAGIPGYNPQATAVPRSMTESVYDFVPLLGHGECFVPEQPNREAVLYCYAHDDCTPYACGTDNSQVVFAASRCMSSCHVNAHCHPSARCSRSSGRCIPVLGSGIGLGGGKTLQDGPTCDLQPHTFCAPYWCSGHRGTPPAPGAECPRYCSNDAGCQPFYECVFPTLSGLKQEYNTAAFSESCDATSGVRSAAKQTLTRRGLELHLDADMITKGKCVPRSALKGRLQPPEDVLAQRASASTSSLLTVPLGGADGRIADPNVQLWVHAPFAPPAPVLQRIGVLVEGTAAACAPYVAVSRGITQSQVDHMRTTSVTGAADHNTGRYTPLPSCKHFCSGDADCVGGYFCTEALRVNVGTSTAGNKVEGKAAEAPASKGMCQRKGGLGASCSRERECESGHCWEGLCCNTACAGSCRSCSRMGICGWVAPHTSSWHCPKCSWCEYVASPLGTFSPSSPMECVPIPEGLDPDAHCGPHAVCNGEGACLASEGWGGQGDTCSVGMSGPNCHDENVFYRATAVVLPYSLDMCTPGEASRLSASPSLPTFGAIAKSTISTRGPTSINPLNAPPLTYTRRMNIIDTRPRQWAQRVLSVSSHSRYGCSNILYAPSRKRSDRVHEESSDSWSPGQYVQTADGVPDERPEKQYFPWSTCHTFLTRGACVTDVACAWYSSPPPGYCRVDPLVAKTMQKPATVTLSAVDPTAYDVNTLPAAQPYEYIELEFESPIFIEAVTIHENYHPGAIVKIETQPALTGSAAVADAGGASYATDPLTGAIITSGTVKTPSRTGGTTVVSTCASLTPQGLEVCVLDTSCFWLSGECRTSEGTCKKIGIDSCKIREIGGLCHWDAKASTCMPGRRSGCYRVEAYDETAYITRCSVFNDKSVYPSSRIAEAQRFCDSDTHCNWLKYVASQCVSTTISCSTQNGKPGGCLAPCLWNESSTLCSDGPLPNAWTREQFCSSVKNAQQCGGLVQCEWVRDMPSEGCLPLTTSQCDASPRDACKTMGACTWVEPPATTPSPNVFTSGCPPPPQYNHSASVRYIEQNGQAAVSITCNEGYQQAGTSVCVPASTSVEGNASCVPLKCPEYPLKTGVVLLGYTASPPFGEREQYSTPILECSNGNNLTGSMPVCQNGGFVGKPPSCGTTASRSAALLDHGQHYVSSTLDEPKKGWWTPYLPDLSGFYPGYAHPPHITEDRTEREADTLQQEALLKVSTPPLPPSPPSPPSPPHSSALRRIPQLPSRPWNSRGYAGLGVPLWSTEDRRIVSLLRPQCCEGKRGGPEGTMRVGDPDNNTRHCCT